MEERCQVLHNDVAWLAIMRIVEDEQHAGRSDIVYDLSNLLDI